MSPYQGGICHCSFCLFYSKPSLACVRPSGRISLTREPHVLKRAVIWRITHDAQHAPRSLPLMLPADKDARADSYGIKAGAIAITARTTCAFTSQACKRRACARPCNVSVAVPRPQTTHALVCLIPVSARTV
eukprot:2105392-Pleurochrysis_carterae.AAC.1